MQDENNIGLETFLNTPDEDEFSYDNYDNLLTDIIKTKKIDLLTDTKTFISDTDKFFKYLMDEFKKSTESTKWSMSLTPQIHNKKIDGFFLSFEKNF